MRFAAAFTGIPVVLVMILAAPAFATVATEGLDSWVTLAGETWADHFNSEEGGDPLPADFFGPGSDPFDGRISLVGAPLGGPFGNIDTIVERLQPADLPDCPSEATVDIQIRALSLASASPITVTFNGGLDPTDYDVLVCLSDDSQPTGSMTIQRECVDGGSVIASDLPVLAKFIFIPVVPGDEIVYDMGAEGDPADHFQFSGPTAPPGWMHNPDELPIVTLPPGLEVDGNCDGVPETILTVGSSPDFTLGVYPDPCDCGTPGGGSMQVKKPTYEETLLARHGVLPPEDPEPEDCCYPDGTCVSGVPDLVCIADGGEVFPAGACLVDPVACCMPDGTCVMTSRLCCQRRGGTPYPSPPWMCMGDLVIVDGIDDLCGPLGACVFPDSTCVDVGQVACDDVGGKFLGVGTTCLTDIPAVTEWGLLVMVLLGPAAGTIMFRKARAAVA